MRTAMVQMFEFAAVQQIGRRFDSAGRTANAQRQHENNQNFALTQAAQSAQARGQHGFQQNQANNAQALQARQEQYNEISAALAVVSCSPWGRMAAVRRQRGCDGPFTHRTTHNWLTTMQGRPVTTPPERRGGPRRCRYHAGIIVF